MIAAVVFDLDGTLVDSRDWHRDALNRALADCGCAPVPDAEHAERFDGLPATDVPARGEARRGGPGACDGRGVNRWSNPVSDPNPTNLYELVRCRAVP